MINKWLNRIDQLNSSYIFWSIVGFSILLAAWMQHIQHGWINPDSILYFEQAKLFAHGKWAAGAKVFEWPLYGLLIAFTHLLSSLSIHASAQLLNMLFFGIATASFIKIIHLTGGKNITLLIGALILSSSQYIVGDALEMLLRDVGFWGFFLASLVFFIKYHQTYRFSDALLWQFFAIIATLFRIEGIMYLIGLPLTLLWTTGQTLHTRTRHYLSANILNIFILLGAIVITITFKSITMDTFGRVNELFNINIYTELVKLFHERAEVMANQVLGQYLDGFAAQGLLLTFLYVVTAKAVSATGFINTTLAVFAIKNRNKLLLNKASFTVLASVATIATINASLIITKVFVLSSRYIVPLAFTLMVFASIFLAHLIKQNSSRKEKVFIAALVFIMLLGLVKNILPKKDGYNYLQDSISWLKENNLNSKKTFFNEARLRHYAGERFTKVLPGTKPFDIHNLYKNGDIYEYPLLVIQSSKKKPYSENYVKENLPEYKEVKRFFSRKNKKFVIVYTLSSPKGAASLYDIAYIQNSISWLKEKQASKKDVFYQDARLAYHANISSPEIKLFKLLALEKIYKNGTIFKYRYLALGSSENDSTLEQYANNNIPEFKETKRFSSANGKKHIIIYEPNKIKQTQRTGYGHIHNAIDWVHSQNLQNDQVFYNTEKLRFYANAPFLSKFFSDMHKVANYPAMKKYQLLVIDARQHESTIQYIRKNLPEYKETQKFYAKNSKDYCVIFQKTLAIGSK